LFWIGLQGYLDTQVAPGDAMEIRVTGAKWLWTFTYPTGYTTTGELRIPKGKPVKIILSAKDVIHSFYIPEFRVKKDAIPGAYTTLWFEATRTGETVLECTEYCGTGHSDMLAKVIMMEQTAFDQWLDDASNEGKNLAPADYGKLLYTKAACNTCHSLDGTKVVGPTFKGLFGRSEDITGGAKVTADENYIRESILVPTAKVVNGFPPVMPAFQGVLNDKQIDALIAYIKTIK
jgi:cytochrome c oxidase subunit 2